MSGTEHSTIPLTEFDAKLRPFLTEVSSSALGGKVLSCSDDFFASKDNLIKPSASVSMKGQFGPNGALYDGWESRRHNPSFDWVIIRLATPLTSLTHVDIDTSHFSGNECPASQIFALRLSPKEIENKNLKLSTRDPRWEEVLGEVALGPNSRHIFKLGSKGMQGTWSAVLVRMIPDGGMARFRAYGIPQAPTLLDVLPAPSVPPINLLSPLRSARIVACSDANFSPPGNLLLPGRGFDMSDGWETRRSQENKGKYAPGGVLHGQERREWVVARLAGTGAISYVEVDTAYHPGNYPVACKVEAILSENELPGDDEKWTTIVDKKPLGAHRQHWFDRERNVAPNAVFSHVRLNIYPDGGLKRLRIYGYPLKPQATTSSPSVPILPALPLTAETFAPYGQVIQGYSFHHSAPKGKHVTVANQGTAFKFHRMANVSETYQPGALVRGGPYVAVTRAKSRLDVSEGASLKVTTLERHRHTHQAFIPMGKGVSPGGSPLGEGGAYLSVVALNGPDDKPDMSTARAFLGTAAQGVSYNMGVWHHSLLTVDGDLDYCLVEAQIGDGSILDVEKHTPAEPYAMVQVDPYTAVPSGKSSLPAKPPANGHSAYSKLNGFVSSLNGIASTGPIVPVHITKENFAPFGQIIQAYPDDSTRWEGQDIQVAPDGMATKYARLADIVSTYPADAEAVTAISVFRATPKVGLERGKVFDIRYMERHPFTTQAFVPMGKGEWKGKGEDALEEGGAMLVIVAENGADDKPDPKTVKAFIMPSSIGISYNVGVWHHPSLVLDRTLDLACIETQISTGIPEADERDCELLSWEDGEAFGQVAVPSH